MPIDYHQSMEPNPRPIMQEMYTKENINAIDTTRHSYFPVGHGLYRVNDETSEIESYASKKTEGLETFVLWQKRPPSYMHYIEQNADDQLNTAEEVSQWIDKL